MSIRALRWAFELPVAGAKKAVLIALADHADADGACFPSVGRLALFAGLRERAVQAALRELESSGVLVTTQQTGQRSRYRLAMNATGTRRPTPARSAPPASTPTPAPDAGDPRTRCGGTPARNAPKPSVQPPLNHHSESTQGDRDLLGPKDVPPPRARTSSRRKPETAIDEAWFPDPAGIEYAKGYGIVDVGFEVEKFRNWHLARDVRRRDWAHAWRNWSQNHKEFHQPRGNGAAGDHTTSTRPAADGGGLVGAAARMWRGRPGGDGDG